MTPFILLAVGLLLVFCEFFLPGGILGTLGVLVVISSIVLFVFQSDSPIASLLFIVGSFVSMGFLFRFALWRIRNAKGSLYSENDQSGFVASSFDREVIGKVGKADSDLRPGGRIILDGKRHQAISQSGYITKGESVIVTGGQGESLTVKNYQEEL